MASIVERVVDGSGRVLPLPAAPAPRRAIAASTAETLAHMMVGTTEWGSANRAFHDRAAHRRRLGGIRVAGKTGTLSDDAMAYSWFVGFAPAESPKVAVAVLLGRQDEDHVRAADVARALLASWLTDVPTPSPVASR